MPSRDDVYRKFGETAEAAQLLETELGTKLLMTGAIELNLIEVPDPDKASEIYAKINRQTLGRTIKVLAEKDSAVLEIENLLQEALQIRNRLSHSFYLKHNLRFNSDHGRSLMLNDLEYMHQKLLKAYKVVLLLGGTDLDKLLAEQDNKPLPTDHLPI